MSAPLPPHLLGLNPEQELAVTTLDGPVLVLAGAGSGKTRVLTRRIAHLLYNGVAAENILAVTFTRKAAQEMKHRVTELVGPAAEQVWVSTFHATCCRILRTDIEALGFTRRFAIYDDDDQLRILREVLRENPESELTPSKVLARIDFWKNRGYDPDRVVAEHREPKHGGLIAAWRAYERGLRAADAVDFNDLIGHVVKMFQEHPAVLERWRERFQYVMVDEYQDTNGLQYKLLRLLAEPRRNLAVVGDDDQSIYAFRGADVTNILNFERDFPNARVIRMERNYRSTANVLAVANAVVRVNEKRIDKQLRTDAAPGKPVNLRVLPTEEDEAKWVADAIGVFQRRDRIPYGSMAIVYRTNATARLFEQALGRARVPYRVAGGKRLHERREVRDVLAWIRLAILPVDDAAFLRIVNVPPRGIGPSTLAALRDAGQAAGQPLLATARSYATRAGPSAAALKGFLTLVESIADVARTGTPAELVNAVLVRTGYRDMLERLAQEEEGARRGLRAPRSESRERLLHLGQLLSDAAVFRAPDAGSAIERTQAWLDQFGLAESEEVVPEGGAVTLLTVHNAKGLEYPVVFSVQLNEGQFPHARALEDADGLSEERRLAYVAFTRAMSRLVITRSATRASNEFAPAKQDDPDKPPGRAPDRTASAPSPFLFGLPLDAVEGDLPGMTPTTGTPGLAPLTVGSKVSHPKHGAGVVKKPRDPRGVIVLFKGRPRAVAREDLTLVPERR